MKLVIVESPFAGEVERNIAYARACVLHSLNMREAPIASHLLYTQPGILDDNLPSDRELGIRAGLEWRRLAHHAVFYIDLGWSSGMRAAQMMYNNEGIPWEERTIGWNGQGVGLKF